MQQGEKYLIDFGLLFSGSLVQAHHHHIISCLASVLSRGFNLPLKSPEFVLQPGRKRGLTREKESVGLELPVSPAEPIPLFVPYLLYHLTLPSCHLATTGSYLHFSSSPSGLAHHRVLSTSFSWLLISHLLLKAITITLFCFFFPGLDKAGFPEVWNGARPFTEAARSLL